MNWRPRHWMQSVAGTIALVLVIAHALATAVYLLPSNYLFRHITPHVRSYMDSFFYQNWHFFAPNPGIKADHLIGKCHFSTRSSFAVDPFSLDFSRDSVTFGVGSISKRQYAHQQIARDLLATADSCIEKKCGVQDPEALKSTGVLSAASRSHHSCAAAFKHLSSTPAAMRARKIISDYCSAIAGQEPRSVDIAIVRSHPASLSQHLKHNFCAPQAELVISLLSGKESAP